MVNILAQYFLMFILIIAPVYRIPGIFHVDVSLVKDLLLFAFLIISLFSVFSKSSKREIKYLVTMNSTIWWGILISLATLTGVLLPSNIWKNSSQWIRFPVAFLLYLGILHLFYHKEKAIDMLLKLVAGSVFFIALVTILEIRGIIASGLSSGSMQLAWAISFCTPIMLYYGLKSKSIFERIIWLSCIVMSIFFTIMTNHRGPFIAGTVSAFIVYLLIAPMKSLSRIAQWFLIIACIILIGEKLLDSFSGFILRDRLIYKDLIDNPFDYDTLNVFSTQRYEIYEAAIESIKKHPLVGIGLNEPLPNSTKTTTLVHNLYLNVAAGSGIIAGFLIFLFTFHVAIKCIIRSKNIFITKENQKESVAIGIIVATLFSAQVEAGAMFYIIYSGIPFWLGLAMLDLHGVSANKTTKITWINANNYGD